ncbi:MAG: cytochrome-c peroxidase [Bacteroidia bacterium]|nr:cytochrome-c peroxidase [Bacteroidia bacterium]
MTLLQTKTKLVGLALLALVLGACKDTETTEPEKTYPTPYELSVPLGFPKPQLSIDNPLTVEGIQMGKMFYSDPILSTNGRTCTSCHQQENSFSSPLFTSWTGVKISVPPHVNLAFKKHYNWEGSQMSLDTLAMGDFEPEFFNTNPDLLYKKISEHPLYPTLFKQAFGVNNVYDLGYHELKKTIAKSIAQYLRTKISINSKFDKFRRREVLLNQMEYEGYVIFFSEKGDCFHCHSEPLFSDQEFHNNGLTASYSGFDKGRFTITNKDEDMGKFLSPTLRNIELTAPYMHDGRLKTLEDVVNHYNEGVVDESHVDPLLTKRDGTKKLNLTPIEKIQLVAFLKTLTDLDYIK